MIERLDLEWLGVSGPSWCIEIWDSSCSGYTFGRTCCGVLGPGTWIFLHSGIPIPVLAPMPCHCCGSPGIPIPAIERWRISQQDSARAAGSLGMKVPTDTGRTSVACASLTSTDSTDRESENHRDILGACLESHEPLEHCLESSWASWASWARVVRVVPFLVVLKLLWALHEPSRLYFGSRCMSPEDAWRSSVVRNSAHFVRCVKYKASVFANESQRDRVLPRARVARLVSQCLPQILYSSSNTCTLPLKWCPARGLKCITWERCKLVHRQLKASLDPCDTCGACDAPRVRQAVKCVYIK